MSSPPSPARHPPGKRSPRPRESEAPGDPAPPVSFCPTCGTSDCPGHADGLATDAALGLPWEQSSEGALRRLWQTANATSIEPERVFAGLPRGRVAPALAFAVAAETLALGSVGVLLAGSFALLAPRWALELASQRWVQLGVGLSLAGSIALMVVMHAIWGYFLEAGARPSERTPFDAESRRQGLRFGLYACGWDLLTSPIGLFHGLLTRGPRGLWAPLAAAMRAPRAALHAYLGGCRSLDERSRLRAMRRSTATLTLALLVTVALVIAVALLLLRALGY